MKIPLCRLAILCVALGICSSYSVAQSPSSYDVLIQKGKTELQGGNIGSALVTGERAIKLDSKRWEGYALAGGALMNLKRNDEAISRLTEAMDRAPQDKQAGLSELRRQCFAAESGTPASAPASPAPPANSSAPEATTTQAEIVLWKSIENSTNPSDFQTYLNQYPNGAFAALARRHFAAVQAQVEQTQWQSIENSTDSADFSTFLRQFPGGKFSAQARQRLAGLPTWTDPATGLMWTGTDNDYDLNWQHASDYCTNTMWAGFGDWRLPTIDELQGIYDEDKEKAREGAIKGTIEIRQQNHGCGWWSSTTSNSPGERLSFTFIRHSVYACSVTNVGTRYSYAVDYLSGQRVLCVRRSKP